MSVHASVTAMQGISARTMHILPVLWNWCSTESYPIDAFPVSARRSRTAKSTTPRQRRRLHAPKVAAQATSHRLERRVLSRSSQETPCPANNRLQSQPANPLDRTTRLSHPDSWQSSPGYLVRFTTASIIPGFRAGELCKAVSLWLQFHHSYRTICTSTP
jgi:hypothetical protein